MEEAGSWQLIVGHDKSSRLCSMTNVFFGSPVSTCADTNEELAGNLVVSVAGGTVVVDATDVLADLIMSGKYLGDATGVLDEPHIVWNFGDGTGVSGPATTHSTWTHTYNNSGKYIVVLTVQGAHGKVLQRAQ